MTTKTMVVTPTTKPSILRQMLQNPQLIHQPLAHDLRHRPSEIHHLYRQLCPTRRVVREVDASKRPFTQNGANVPLQVVVGSMAHCDDVPLRHPPLVHVWEIGTRHGLGHERRWNDANGPDGSARVGTRDSSKAFELLLVQSRLVLLLFGYARVALHLG